MRAVAFSLDGRVLASGEGATVVLWDVTEPAHPATTATLTGHGGEVRGVAFSPAGQLLASSRTCSGEATTRGAEIDQLLQACQVQVVVGAGPADDQAALIAAERGRAAASGLFQLDRRTIPALGIGQDVDVAVGAPPGQNEAALMAAERRRASVASSSYHGCSGFGIPDPTMITKRTPAPTRPRSTGA